MCPFAFQLRCKGIFIGRPHESSTQPPEEVTEVFRRHSAAIGVGVGREGPDHLLLPLALGPGQALEHRFLPAVGQEADGSPVWKRLALEG